MAAHLRACWRLARALPHVAAGWLTIAFVFPTLEAAERHERVQRWAAEMLRRIGVRLEVHGAPPAHGPMLLVANHISWLDILVMHAARHCRFVAKSDIRRWPLIGTLASGAGTLYIERESRRDAMRVVHRMAESLRAGDVIGIFPEGTTTDGTFLLPFHANLLQAAISTGTPVQPMALGFYAQDGTTCLAPRYDGDISLLASVWSTLAADVSARVVFGEPQSAEGRERRAWAHDLQAAVARLGGETR